MPILGVSQGACPHFLLQGTGHRPCQAAVGPATLGMAQQCSKGAPGQTSRWLGPARQQTGHRVTPGAVAVVAGTVLAARLLRLSTLLRLRCLCSPASTVLWCVPQGSGSAVLELGKAAGSAHTSQTRAGESELPTEQQGTETPEVNPPTGIRWMQAEVQPSCTKMRSPDSGAWPQALTGPSALTCLKTAPQSCTPPFSSKGCLCSYSSFSSSSS